MCVIMIKTKNETGVEPCLYKDIKKIENRELNNLQFPISGLRFEKQERHNTIYNLRFMIYDLFFKLADSRF